MATTSPILRTPFTLGAGSLMGQGDRPEIQAFYSTADATAAPSWTQATESLRAFSTSRGRETELDRVNGGSATITLDNRERTFDPTVNSSIRPLNQWWLRAQFSGATHDVFKGYAEAYDLQWPDGTGLGGDALAIVTCADEMKVLNMDKLPTMNPPRDTYEELVKFDNPQGYWMLHDNTPGGQYPSHGSDTSTFIHLHNTTFFVTSPIVGDASLRLIGTSNLRALRTDTFLSTANRPEDGTGVGQSLDPGGPGDAGGLSSFTVELWFKSSEAAPAATRDVIYGPQSGGLPTWGIQLGTGGNLYAFAVNSGGTNYNATSPSAISADVWYHIALVVTGSNLLLYVNGAQVAASGAFTGSIGAMTAGSYMYLGTLTAVGGNRSYDEPAFYRTSLTADRIAAHYTAGVNRGFPAQDPGARMTAVLDVSTSNSPRNIRAGSRELHPVFQHGQPPLDELRQAEKGEAVDAVLFVAKDGTITFLDDGHRSVSPWNTVQATFSDDGTGLPYLDLDVDYSESFLFNEWNVTRTNGTTTSVSDTTSKTRYFQRPQSITDLPITTDSDQSAIASAMLAKYKDPFTRVTRLELSTMDAGAAEAALDLEIGDRIRVLRTPPGSTLLWPGTSVYPGTSLYPLADRIDQTLFIQKIAMAADNQRGPWQISLGVSPL